MTTDRHALVSLGKTYTKLGTAGIEFAIQETKTGKAPSLGFQGKVVGYLYVTKAGIRWYPKRTTKNPLTLSWGELTRRAKAASS